MSPSRTPTEPQRVEDLARSLIRTWAPMAVGAVVAWLATRFDIVVSEDLSAQAAIWIAGAVMAAYYWAARWLERRRGAGLPGRAARWLGKWMLGGVIHQPTYGRR